MHLTLRAQTVPIRSALQTVDSLYNSGAYLSAEVEARRLLEYYPFSDTAFVTLHKYIAFSLIAQGKPDIAREHFKSILTIDPGFTLDPIYTSPKILIVFNETKQSVLSSEKISNDTLSFPMKSNSPSITYRTIVFPGWEQLHSGRTTAGYLFISAGIVSLSTGITFEFLRSSAREKYLSATLPSDISLKYRTYNQNYKAEIVFICCFCCYIYYFRI